MEINSYAPVLIPTLCRYEHFKRCITSLAACTHASETIVYIALDYPLTDIHWEGYNRINQYINDIQGFKEVRVIRREINLGAEKNLEDAKTIVYQDFDSYILSEDDNEFAPNFLDYMNKCLTFFRDNPCVYSVCGYNFPVASQNFNNSCYFNNLYSAWGAGMWKDKEFMWNIMTAKSLLSSPMKLFRLYFVNPKYILSLLRMIKSNKTYGDLLVCAYSIANKKVNVFPSISKVRNHGHDGTGEHSTTDAASLYDNQIIDTDIVYDLDFNNVVVKRDHSLDKYQDISFGQKMKIIPKLLLYWLHL